ncbi:MAG: hypothetical protein U0231_14490 [Nitrospiraceae bacterium]
MPSVPACVAMFISQAGLVRVGQERTVAAWRGLVARLLKQAGQLFHGKDRLLIGLERRLLSGANPPLVVVPSDYVGRQLNGPTGCRAGRFVECLTESGCGNRWPGIDGRHLVGL